MRSHILRLTFVVLTLFSVSSVASAATFYGETAGEWRIADNTPSGATLEQVYEPLLGKLITVAQGADRANAYQLGGNGSATAWNNQSEHILSWRLSASSGITLYVHIETALGWRYLYYNHSPITQPLKSSGRYIHHGLGRSLLNGEWNTWTRNLESDLKDAEPNNELLAVHGLMVRGNMRIDNVSLRDGNQMIVAPVTPVNISPAQNAAIEVSTSQTFVWQEQSVASTYDFHLFNELTSELTYINGIDPAIACEAGECRLTSDVNLPIHNNHAWRVRANNAAGSSAWSRSVFDVVKPLTSMPSEPVITSPAVNAVFAPNVNFELTWQVDELASSYDFGIYDPISGATTYRPTIEATQACNATRCTIYDVGNLPASEGYMLRLRAKNRLGNSSWAEQEFSVIEPITIKPLPPTLLSPVVGADLVAARAAEFIWMASDTADTYDFYFYDTITRTSTFTNNLPASTVCLEGVCRLTTLVDLTLNESHIWRVRAGNAAGKSGYARAVFNVVPLPETVPDTPTVISPESNSLLVANETQLFTWQPVAAANSYDFHFTDLERGIQPFVLNLLASDICSELVCEYETTLMETVAIGHSWHVRSVNDEGASDWSRTVFTARDANNPNPVAEFSVSAVQGEAPFDIALNASFAYDAVAITEYQWDFGDGQGEIGADAVTVNHQYALPGTYTITLEVKNADDLVGTKSKDVIVIPAIPENAPSQAEAARLLAQASFGASSSSIRKLRVMGIEPWIDAQLQLQGPAHLDYVNANSNGSNRDARHEVWWLDAVDGDDQLRQRVAFALSQLLVVSDTGFTLGNAQYGITHYYDILRNNAFGNYRELLEEITLTPVMGIYLSMLQNDKGSVEKKTRADENFAREILQLFTIGLHNLNQDGTRSGGNTFTQDQIESFARVFTGWNYKAAGKWERELFTGQDLLSPMEAFEDHHDTGEKRLLNDFVVPPNQSAREDLEMALDNIFEHPNVAPFVSSHLIRQLVTSNPTPAYVNRVAAIFNDNGSGIKGDLGATVKAILLDDEARNPASLAAEALANYGKLREPVLRLTHLWRAFSVQRGNLSSRGEYNTYSPSLKDIDSVSGQAVLKSASVFNFFSPSYSPSGPIKNAQLIAPEFDIFTDSNILTMASRINSQIHRHYKQNISSIELNPSYLDFEPELALANDTNALLDHLNILLLSGSMSEALRAVLFSHLDSLQDTPSGLIQQVQDAVSLIVASPEYLVQR